MALIIPTDFDYKAINLDPLEIYVRDELNINIENWAKFRHTILATVSAESLKSNITLSDDIKNSYIELSKSHYEVVTMLGAMKISLINLQQEQNNLLIFKKNFKEFYLHTGAVLDNLARLIYIVNIQSAPTAIGKFDKKIRHSIYFSSLKNIYMQNKSSLKGYYRLINNKSIKEIVNIRNNFAHSWPPVIFTNPNNQLLWPTRIRKKSEYFLWPHDPEEAKKIKQKYRKKVRIVEMIHEDWITIETLQNLIFERLYIDIYKFEKNHNLIIQ